MHITHLTSLDDLREGGVRVSGLRYARGRERARDWEVLSCAGV